VGQSRRTHITPETVGMPTRSGSQALEFQLGARRAAGPAQYDAEALT